MGFNSTLKFHNLHCIPGLAKLSCTEAWLRAAAVTVRLIGRDQILSASRTKEESTNLSMMQNLEKIGVKRQKSLI